MRACVLLALAFLLGCEQPPAPRTIVVAQAAPQPSPHSSRGSAVLERLGIAVRASPHGLVIVAADLDGPAAAAGAQVGDILAEVNGAPVASAAELERSLGAAPGALRLGLRRGGETRVIAVPPKAAETAWNPLGLQVRELPDAARRALGLGYGVMVTKVRSPADRSRILPGDVIMAVNQTRIRSLEEFNRMVDELKAGTVGLLVRRADADLFIPLDAGGDASRGGSNPLQNRPATGTPLRT